MDKKDVIRKYALQNAVQHEGTANMGSVIAKVFNEMPELKPKAKEISKEVKDIVDEVNQLDNEVQLSEIKGLAPELLEKKEKVKREGLNPLKNTEKGAVVMRFAPSPSGPMHIGHAYTLGLNAEYVKMYDGKLIFRIEDTNPENIYPLAYEMMPEEAQWIADNNVAEIFIQSDRMRRYYKAAVELFKRKAMYICDCDPEKFRDLLKDMKPCPCRKISVEDNLERWDRMLGKGENPYPQGGAVVRVRTSVEDPNPAMRDFPVLRINESEHPRQKKKYRVWPLMNFAVFVDDLDYGMTHIIRGKDHFDNAKRQAVLFQYMQKPVPETLFHGRIHFEGMEVSCSKTKKKIEEGKYTGWDDIRIPFLVALKRRGYQAAAFRRWAVDQGVSMTDKSVEINEFFKNINHFNKEVIDPVSNRYFFVWDPKEITVDKAVDQDVELDLHPDNKKGGRKFKTGKEFYVTDEDSVFTDGKLYRLMDCLNFVSEKGKLSFDSTDYETFKDKGDKIIHWLPKSDDLVKVEVLMPDNRKVKGLGEEGMKELKVGDVVQLERFGFCRLDSIDKEQYNFWYAHK